MPSRTHDLPATFNPERAPVLGTNITEGVSLQEMIDFMRDRHDEMKLVVTDGTWVNGLAKSVGLIPAEQQGETDVPTDRS